MVLPNGLALAYLGDGVYELMVRKHLIAQGYHKVDDLHQMAVAYTNADGQTDAFDKIEPHLTEAELSYFKKGRNAKTDRKAKSASLLAYRQATGLEALFGALYLLEKQDRIQELMDRILSDNTEKQTI